MRCPALFALALIVVAGSALADETPQRGPAKRVRAWELDADERIALRFDPRAAAARHAKAVAKGWSIQADTHVVVGRDNPELLLRWELVDYLQQFYDTKPDTQQENRQEIRERAHALGIGQDFFDRLQAIVRPVFDARTEAGRLVHAKLDLSKDDPEYARLDVEARRVMDWTCASRTASIAAARQQFGWERFDRFLYEVVAPAVTVLYPRPDPEELLRLEQGCR